MASVDEAMTEEEEKYTKTFLSITRTPLYVGVILFLIIVSIPVVSGDSSGNGSVVSDILFILLMCFCVAAALGLLWWPFRYVSVDCKVGEKTVETTIIERLQKVGFFEMQADSALGIMAGAIYYLWLPDETRSPPHRRFRIGLTTYRQLMLYGNGPIEISYLPKSGMILSIDIPGYRYAAYESPKERHKIG